MSGRIWVSYDDLKPNDRFRFVYNATIAPRLSPDVFVKGENGWYRKLNDPKASAWRTGPHTAVAMIRLP